MTADTAARNTTSAMSDRSVILCRQLAECASVKTPPGNTMPAQPGETSSLCEQQEPCLYGCAVRQAIVAQHALDGRWPLRLLACGGCGAPFLVHEMSSLHETSYVTPARGDGCCPACGRPAGQFASGRTGGIYWLGGRSVTTSVSLR